VQNHPEWQLGRAPPLRKYGVGRYVGRVGLARFALQLTNARGRRGEDYRASVARAAGPGRQGGVGAGLLAPDAHRHRRLCADWAVHARCGGGDGERCDAKAPRALRPSDQLNVAVSVGPIGCQRIEVATAEGQRLGTISLYGVPPRPSGRYLPHSGASRGGAQRTAGPALYDL
jgi:hypothetical protein